MYGVGPVNFEIVRCMGIHWICELSFFKLSYGGYYGPWIENKWIDEAKKITSQAEFEKMFPDRIPLFIQWVDHQVKCKNLCDLIDGLFELLKPEYDYMTVR